MNYNNQDIIIARSTPIGSSALAVVRLSGGCLDRFLPIVNKKKLKPRYNYTVEFKSFKSKKLIDTCVMVYYKAPSSFTGEDMLEISCHGNDFIVETIIGEFIEQGARIAYPGEFSYRAFQNNKIDLMQAESISAKITANSGSYGVALQNIENGATSKRLAELKDVVLNVITIIEHELDFNEEEIDHLKTNDINKEFKKIRKSLSLILKRSEAIKEINRGYNVVILGLPNVGKSTLFNKILGVDRALVTSIKGTTRDFLEAKITIKNIPFTFFDTAGYRKTKNKIEGMGIKKGLALLKCADVVLVVDDKNPQKILQESIAANLINQDQQVVCVKTKCDQLKKGNRTTRGELKISAKNNVGINRLLTHLLTCVASKIDKPTYADLVVCNERQFSLIKEANKNINLIIQDLEAGCSMDIVASGCRVFVQNIEDLLGVITPEDVLNKIFKGFCVGK